MVDAAHNGLVDVLAQWTIFFSTAIKRGVAG
jgi:hypothetical protein